MTGSETEPERMWEPAPSRETKATREQIEGILAPVRALTLSREIPWRNTGLKLRSLGLTIPEIEGEFRPWCCDRQAHKKLAGVIRLLRKNERARTMIADPTFVRQAIRQSEA